MIFQVPPASGGNGQFPPFLSKALWDALERLIPSGPGPSAALTLSPRPLPGSDAPAFWAEEIRVLLPPPPPEFRVPPVPLTAVVLRSGTEWIVRAGPHPDSSGAREKHTVWEWRFPGRETIVPVPKDAPEFAKDTFHALSRGRVSDGMDAPLRDTDLFQGPYPSGPGIGPKPELCEIEVRWPSSDGSGGEGAGASAESLFPFRIEVRYPGGETAAVGGVYDAGRKSLSVSSRTSPGPLADFWRSAQPGLAADLFAAFGIRCPGGGDPGSGMSGEAR